MQITELTNKYLEKIEILKNFYHKYFLNIDEIKKLADEIKNFYVVTPLIGGFSTGKSSLVNELIEKKLLPVEITPETAIPTEILYSTNERAEKLTNEIWENISIESLRENKYNYSDTKLIRTYINQPFLSKIPTVKLVDIPGLDSGIESHNRAIDDYLLKSLAYIITVDCEQGLTESVILFLKELNLLTVPVLIVLTKIDKKTESDVQAMLNDIKMKSEKIIVNGGFEITKESVRLKDTDGVKNFLINIQNKATDIFEADMGKKFSNIVHVIERYIKTRLNSNDFSVEEIEEKEKLLTKQISELSIKIEKEKSSLNNDIEKCINVAEGKIRIALESAENSLVNDLINHQDISQQINSLVRTSMLETIQTEITPRIQRFFKNLADESDYDIQISNDITVDPLKNELNDLMKDSVKKLIPLGLASVGFAIAGPIGGIIVGVLSILTEMFFANRKKEQERQAAEEKVRNEIIPQAASRATQSFRNAVIQHLDEISLILEESISKDKEVKEQALADLKNQKTKAHEEQAKIIDTLKADLAEIQKLII